MWCGGVRLGQLGDVPHRRGELCLARLFRACVSAAGARFLSPVGVAGPWRALLSAEYFWHAPNFFLYYLKKEREKNPQQKHVA